MISEVPKILLSEDGANRWQDLAREAINRLVRLASQPVSDPYVPPRWTDLMVPESSIRVGGTAPALTTFLGGTRLYAFDAGEEVEMTVQMPHGWKLGSAIHPHIHVACPNATIGNYVWGLEYTIAQIGHVFPATTTIETTIRQTPGQANKHVLDPFPMIDMTRFAGLSTMFVGRLYRKSGVSGNYGSSIFLLEFDLHYQADAAGSHEEMHK